MLVNLITPKDFYKSLGDLPELPGVYRYFGVNDVLLYVGKARNLKKRVASYFNKTLQSERIALMVSKIVRLELTITPSEHEALLLEYNLIQRYTPRYNIVFRDDKSYPYLKLSNHLYPRISYHRGKIDTKNLYFGPFPDAGAVRDSIKIIQQIFKLRTCTDNAFSNRSRPCLLFQIKRCTAPCCEYIEQGDYDNDVKQAKLFLSGQHKQVVSVLSEQMNNHSANLEFESAAKVHNQIQTLTTILQQQNIIDSHLNIVNSKINIDNQCSENIESIDVIAVAIHNGQACVNLAMIRTGRHLGDCSYFPEYSQTYTQTYSEILVAFIMQHYLTQNASNLPDKIIISHPLIDSELIGDCHGKELKNQELEKELGKQLEKLTSKVCKISSSRLKKEHKAWLSMALQNSKLALERQVAKTYTQTERINSLIDVLNLKTDPEKLRIECFDISHTSGQNTQAACVVFANQKLQTSLYRRFNIGTITASDDYAAMEQVLRRRYQRHLGIGDIKNKENHKDDYDDLHKLPDIVLVDGGVGHVNVARKVFESLNCNLNENLAFRTHSIYYNKIVGIAKGAARKVGNEILVFADGRQPIYLGSNSPALLLLAEIRDEAHRFAITGMRAIRSKSHRQSSLENIEGIGPKRRQKLLTHFGSIKEISLAGVAELAAIDGISNSLANDIYKKFHN